MRAPGALTVWQHGHPGRRPATLVTLGESERHGAAGERALGLGLGDVNDTEVFGHVAPLTAQAHRVDGGAVGQVVQADGLLRRAVRSLAVRRQALQVLERDADDTLQADGVGAIGDRRMGQDGGVDTSRIVTRHTAQGIRSQGGSGCEGHQSDGDFGNELLHDVLLARGWVMRCACTSTQPRLGCLRHIRKPFGRHLSRDFH